MDNGEYSNQSTDLYIRPQVFGVDLMFKKLKNKPSKLENTILYSLALLVFIALFFLFGYALDKELENQEKYNTEQAKQYCSVNQCKRD